MSSLIAQIRQGQMWDFPGGIHPPENKAQSTETAITYAPLAPEFIIPLKQHIGRHGDMCISVGDKVLKGQQLTQPNLAFMVPIHAPTSGTVVAIENRTVAHPSGLSDLCVVIKPDGQDTWGDKDANPDYRTIEPETLIEKIRQAGIAGLGGAGFPTGRKLHTGLGKIEVLIINAAECEPYITADDRLMRDYADEVIAGIQVLQHILKPEITIIGIEDNKPQALKALEIAAQEEPNLVIRAIPTKYPSGGSKQLIKILTGREVPSKAHSASVGVLMQNVGTAFAVKRAIIDGEPLIERVVTFTGDAFEQKGNAFVRLGTPVEHLLKHYGYQQDKKLPRVIIGGSLMGFTLPHTNVPITKITNCILAPKRRELPIANNEMACIRCTACAEACPASLLPQQLQWYAKDQDYEKCQEYHLFDCIECGACAYVCPSEIPLVQYYRQAKAEIKARNVETENAERARVRFEEKQARMERDKQERENRHQQAAQKRRAEMAQKQAQGGEDAVAAAIARVKAKQQDDNKAAVKPAVAAAIARAKAKQAEAVQQGADQPDNSEMSKLREERKRLARERKAEVNLQTATNKTAENTVAQGDALQATAIKEDKKSAVAAAIARAKARKAQASNETANTDTAEPTDTAAASENKKAAVAAAIARAKARKVSQSNNSEGSN